MTSAATAAPTALRSSMAVPLPVMLSLRRLGCPTSAPSNKTALSALKCALLRSSSVSVVLTRSASATSAAPAASHNGVPSSTSEGQIASVTSAPSASRRASGAAAGGEQSANESLRSRRVTAASTKAPITAGCAVRKPNVDVHQRRLRRGVRQRGRKRAKALHATDEAIVAVKAHDENAAQLQGHKRRLSAQQPRRVVPRAFRVSGRDDLQHRQL